MTKDRKLRYEQTAVSAYKNALRNQVEQSRNNAAEALGRTTAELQKSTLEVQKLELELRAIQVRLEILRPLRERLVEAVALGNAQCTTLDLLRKALSPQSTSPSK